MRQGYQTAKRKGRNNYYLDLRFMEFTVREEDDGQSIAGTEEQEIIEQEIIYQDQAVDDNYFYAVCMM